MPQTLLSAEQTKDGVSSLHGAPVEEAGVQTRESQHSMGSAETGVKKAFQVLGGQRWSQSLGRLEGGPIPSQSGRCLGSYKEEWGRYSQTGRHGVKCINDLYI